MKFLFVGLGSISAKHIKDLLSIAGKRNCVCEITVLRRAVSNIPNDLQAYNIKQITELDETIYDATFVTNPTNLHYNALEQLKDKTKFYFIEKPILNQPSMILRSSVFRKTTRMWLARCDIRQPIKN